MLHVLVERYGLLAVFLGCIAEGESAAIVGGFFAHQRLLGGWPVFLAAFAGSFLGDTLFFLAGRYFSHRPFVRTLHQRPAFAYARRMVRAYPAPYVLLNRYVYGFRLLGGVVAGMSDIGLPTFLILNAIASVIWASLFTGLGYAFGTGAEQVIGTALAKHERLLLGLGLGACVAASGWYAIRRVRRHLHSQRRG